MAGSSNKSYTNTPVNAALLRSCKILAARKGMRLNQLLEDLIRKYESTEHKIRPSRHRFTLRSKVQAVSFVAKNKW